MRASLILSYGPSLLSASFLALWMRHVSGLQIQLVMFQVSPKPTWSLRFIYCVERKVIFDQPEIIELGKQQGSNDARKIILGSYTRGLYSIEWLLVLDKYLSNLSAASLCMEEALVTYSNNLEAANATSSLMMIGAKLIEPIFYG